MYEKLKTCPSCDHPKFDNYLICKDHTVSDESFALVRCQKCKLIFTNPRPDSDRLPGFYESDQYISHTNKSRSLIQTLYKIVRTDTLKKKRKLISSLHTKGTVLDYGCGTGHFLKECEQHGWEVTGIEPNEQARQQAQEKLKKGRLFSEFSQLEKKEKFDIITAWHVIEHVPDLIGTMKKLKKKLKKEGHLIIAVPNPDSHDAQTYQEHWAGYDVPRHLYHFTPTALSQLVKKAKLTLLETLPMKFDAFYVSLLSEKYRNGKSRLFAGLRTGLQSNRKAVRSGNYSSLIYILKK